MTHPVPFNAASPAFTPRGHDVQRGVEPLRNYKLQNSVGLLVICNDGLRIHQLKSPQ